MGKDDRSVVVKMKMCDQRFSLEAIAFMQEEIRDADENEVLFIGHLDDTNMVTKVEVGARGDEGSVNALLSWLERGDVVIHNHPNGLLKPSQADLAIASKLGDHGYGFFIVDNKVERYYCVAEPAFNGPVKKLDKSFLLNSLEPGGPLSKLYNGYEYRESQVEMISLIVDAFNENKVAVAEAGTGVGKSLAYLLPSIMWAITNKEKVVISTATINLQQQIYEKDLPLAMKVLGKEVEAVLVKGRGNYLCLRRLEETAVEQSLFEEDNKEFEELQKWAKATKEGCSSELPFKVNRGLWAKICSEADNCRGLKCNFREECFVLKMKKRATKADIIVANHHILFADLAYRAMGAGYDQAAVLPLFKKVVLDEAHNIENNATSFFSTAINRFTFNKVASKISTHLSGGAYKGIITRLNRYSFKDDTVLSDIPKAVEKCQQIMELIDQYGIAMTPSDVKGTTMRFKASALTTMQMEFLEIVKKFSSSLSLLYNLLSSVKSQLPKEDKKDQFLDSDLTVILSRLSDIATLCSSFLTLDEHLDYVFWTKKEKSSNGTWFLTINATPISISKKLLEALFEPIDSVICCSATLSINNSFDYFLKRCGASLVEKKRLLLNSFSSPFNYKKNVLLQVPIDGPLPSDTIYQKYVSRYLLRSLEMSQGRGLVLFTSIDMMEKTYQEVSLPLSELGITCYKQGDQDSAALLRAFNENITSVLFATSSFWQGVDSPGETLSIVIITKLPFSVPTDPLSQAREEAILARGGNPFFEIEIPEAVMKLKQGFGRLVRKKDDRGVVTILDSRVVKKHYGSVFINSLPETAKSFVFGKNLMDDLERFLY